MTQDVQLEAEMAKSVFALSQAVGKLVPAVNELNRRLDAFTLPINDSCTGRLLRGLSTTIQVPGPKTLCTECGSVVGLLSSDLIDTGMMYCNTCKRDTRIKALRAKDIYAFCQHCNAGTLTGETVISSKPFVTEHRCYECGRLR